MKEDKMLIFESAQEIIRSARTGDYSTASSHLNRFLQIVQTELKHKSNLPSFKKIIYSLETLSIMQSQNNWVAFADVLEYELLPLLKNW